MGELIYRVMSIMSSMAPSPTLDKKSESLTLKSQGPHSSESPLSVSPQLFNTDPHLLSSRDIVRLQRTIGNQATLKLLRGTGTPSHVSASLPSSIHSASQSLQRKFISQTAPMFPSPARAAKQATEMSAKFGQTKGPVGDIERPEELTAKIDKDTLREDPRPPQTLLSNVTGMARDEQAILKGSSTDGYYDGGHLIADELIGKEINSFTYSNVASQHKKFNQDSYRVFENKVKRWAQWGNTVTLTAKLQYEDPYEVTAGSLIDSGLIKESELNGMVSSTVKANKNTKIKIARRVPQSWSLSAKMENYKQDKKNFPITEQQERAKYIQKPDYANPFATSIGFAKGHEFNISKALKGVNLVLQPQLR